MADKLPTPMIPFGGGDLIPRALQREQRWAPWITQWLPKARGGEGKWDKRPGLGKSTARPATWLTFDDALAEYHAHPGRYAGIGFVTTGQAVIVGVDLDHCVVDGAIAPWAAEVVDQLASYTEISPSGTGLRIMVQGQVPNDWNNHEVGIEIYGGNTARFLTITGRHLPGTPLDVCAAPAGSLDVLEKRYAKERAKADVIDISMPDVIDDMLLPSIENLDLPYKARDFLLQGDTGVDRSLTLFSTAVALFAAGLPDAEVFSLLVNNEHAMALALDKRHQDYDKALLYLWREDCCKGRAKATPRITAEDFDVVAEPTPYSIADDFDVLEQTTPGESVSRDLSPVKPARFQFLPAAEFVLGEEPEYLVDDVLPEASLIVVFGESGSGKSFFMIDIMASVARGIPWRDKAVKQGTVAYVCAEGAGGFKRRLKAYAAHEDISLADLPIEVLGDAPNLMETTDVRDLVVALQQVKPCVVVIDTFSQSFIGNENSGEDVGRALKHCKLIHKVTGAPVILVHHSGKDASKGVRGWSGLRAAADAEIEIVRAGDDRAATITKMKDGEDGMEFGFKLTTVALGTNARGKEITSCVLEHTVAVPKAERKTEPKGANEKLVLKTVEDLTEFGSDEVDANTLLEAAVSRMLKDPNAKRDRRRELAARALEKLRETNRVIFNNGTVRLA